MQFNRYIRPVALGVSALGFALALSLPASAQVSITVNGNSVNFSPPPVERAGRVFVPLRGVFERLGASVVYANRVINATGNGRNISLTIGSNQASVNGAPQTVDVAPFIIGASTYVPLRFVSQALGASVNYDSGNRVVAISMSGGGNQQGNNNPPPPRPVPPVAGNIQLVQENPPSGGYVGSVKPTISAEFNGSVDPNTVRVSLDGLDITSQTTRSTGGFVYAPPSPLESKSHTVRVTGKDAGGATFDRSYSFTSGTERPHNSLTLSAPAEGAAVPGTFRVTGHTLPNARVHFVAGAVASFGGVFAFGTGNYTGDVDADGNGNFSQEVSLNTVSGGSIGLTVTSTDPVTKESAQKKLNLRAL